MDDKQKLEEKIGEALGLEMAAQKAVEEFEWIIEWSWNER